MKREAVVSIFVARAAPWPHQLAHFEQTLDALLAAVRADGYAAGRKDAETRYIAQLRQELRQRGENLPPDLVRTLEETRAEDARVLRLDDKADSNG